MKTIVALSGFGDKNTRTMNFVEHIVNLSGKKNPKVTIVPTAMFDEYDTETRQEEYPRFKELDCRITILKLSEYKRRTKKLENIILGSDIIYVPGGNLLNIISEWKRTGADELMIEAYEREIVIAGMSAGSMIWFDRAYETGGIDGSFLFVNCLGVLPYCFCPHFPNDMYYTFSDAVKEQKLPGVAVQDGVALEVIDGNFRVIKEMEERNAYFYNPENGYKKQKVSKNGRLLNENNYKKTNE